MTIQKKLLGNVSNSKRHLGLLLFIFTLFISGCEQEYVNHSMDSAPDDNLTQIELSAFVKNSFETDFFITEWVVPKDVVVALPLDTTFLYNFIVDWGDNSSLQQITNQNYYSAFHRYDKSGIYQVRIIGTCETFKWAYDNEGKKYLTRIVQWGNVNFKSLHSSFSGCVALNSIAPGIPNVEDYNGAFSSCTGLTSIPFGLFTNCYKAKSFTSLFSGCKNIKSIPDNLFKDCTAAEVFSAAFLGTGLMFLPDGLFANCHNANSFSMTFGNCSLLMDIPENLFVDCENAVNFFRTFWNCTSLGSIPTGIFSRCRKTTQFAGTFLGCSGLKGTTPKTLDNIELWQRAGKQDYPNQVFGTLCFSGCVNLDNYSTIPADWK